MKIVRAIVLGLVTLAAAAGAFVLSTAHAQIVDEPAGELVLRDDAVETRGDDLVIDVLENDSIPPGVDFELFALSRPQYGTLTTPAAPDRTFLYEPAVEGFEHFTADSFRYLVRTAAGRVYRATVHIARKFDEEPLPPEQPRRSDECLFGGAFDADGRLLWMIADCPR